MRQIEYIFIDSDSENHGNKSGNNDLPSFRYHFIVNREGIVINTTDIQYPVNLVQGHNYDRNKYNRYSIFIRYCGSLKPETCNLKLRTALLNLLVELRHRFPDAKILGLSELDGRELYHKNIIVSDAMNLLRSELSDLP